MAHGPRLLLVGMPWESVSRPSLAIGTLVALARDAGFDCAALHLNLDLAAQMGSAAYDAFAENIELFPLGEHFFAIDLFGAETLDSERYLARFGGVKPAAGEEPDPLYGLKDGTVPDFLAEAVDTVVGMRPDVVGFSCTFNQVLPSLALARRLKALLPGVTILFGGACVHGQMGQTYARIFPEWIDYVFTGEADRSFPAWLEAYVAGEPDRPIAGVATQRGFTPGTPTIQLDRLPVPIYDAYFDRRARLAADGATMRHVRHLPYESSRGCWWGEHHHCTFCGLNNEGMLFRRKSPARVVAELQELVERYGVTSLMASDNILDFKAFTGLLEDIGGAGMDLDLFYEIKANISRANVAALKRAGVGRVQPGIEGFSDHVLHIMRKGITGLQNVQALKWLQEYDIKADYNILIGFPGETLEDYLETIAIMRAIPHLPAPHGGAIKVRVDRFSPFFEDSAALGIRNVRAADFYRHLIPPDRAPAEQFAYFFDHDQSDIDPFEPQIAEINALMAAWKEHDLERRARLGRNSVELLQATTAEGRTRHILRGLDAQVFVMADRVTSLSRLTSKFAATASADEVLAAVARLIDAQAVFQSRDQLVATIAYAVPHTQDELHAWVARNGGVASEAEGDVVTLQPRARDLIDARLAG